LIPAVSSIRVTVQALVDDVDRADRGFGQVAIALIEHPEADPVTTSALMSEEAGRLGGLALPVGRDRTMIMTTRGAVEVATDGFLGEPMITRAASIGIGPRVGYGFGRSAREADHRAGHALARARAVGEPAAAAMLGVDGPRLLAGGPIVRRAQSFRHLARQAGVRESVIRGLARAAQERPEGLVTSADVAAQFGITQRSGRRIIERLERLGLAHSIHTPRTTRVGRPPSVYRLDF
jgi:hypothetical protein